MFLSKNKWRGGNEVLAKTEEGIEAYLIELLNYTVKLSEIFIYLLKFQIYYLCTWNTAGIKERVEKSRSFSLSTYHVRMEQSDSLRYTANTAKQRETENR